MRCWVAGASIQGHAGSCVRLRVVRSRLGRVCSNVLLSKILYSKVLALNLGSCNRTAWPNRAGWCISRLVANQSRVEA